MIFKYFLQENKKMRKNIFDIIAEREINLDQEAIHIETLLSQSVNYAPNGIEFEVKGNIFSHWKYSDTFIDSYEYRKNLGISHAEIKNGELTLNKLLIFIEYAINIVFLTFQIDLTRDYRDKDRSVHSIKILNKIKLLLSKFNYKFENIDDDDDIKYIVIEDNPAATAVAEMVEDDDVSRDIIRYNHFMLMGNLSEKKKILSQLHKEFEKIKGKLIANNNRTMASNCGMLFNALKIRHENHVDPEIAKRVEDMTDVQLEDWYDKTYDLFLTSELVANYIDMGKDIEWLKKGKCDDN